MENGAGTAAAMEGVHASVASLDALFLEDAALTAGAAAGSGVGSGVDVLQRAYELRLDRLGLLSKLEAQVAALKVLDAAEAIELQHAMTPPEATVHDRTYAEMSAVEEIAGVLTISSPAAGALVAQSRQLCSLPLAISALSSGTITWQHARIIADETEALGPAGGTALVAHFLDPDAPNPARGAAAGDLVPSRFRAKVRTWRERHHPASLETRHAKSLADRRMEYSPDRDGMAWISAYLPADKASALWNNITATARGLQGPNEPRTLTQLRPDILCNRVLGDRVLATGSVPAWNTPRTTGGGQDTNDTHETAPEAAEVPTPRTDVLVTVPVFALLGLTNEPAMLDGHGPIPASMARQLLADGASSFYRVLTDPGDGAPLEIGRTSYRLTKAMKQALRLRDGKCTFPGCNNRTPDNETDHLHAWRHGGTTGFSNLAQLCPKHHRLKHNTAWTPTPATRNEPPGWTSPAGRHYKSEQPDREPPSWPGAFGGHELWSPPDASTGNPSPVAEWMDSPRQYAEPPYVEPSCLEPPCEEPSDQNLVDADDIPPDDALWEDFYAKPYVLPPDPVRNWDVVLSWVAPERQSLLNDEVMKGL